MTADHPILAGVGPGAARAGTGPRIGTRRREGAPTDPCGLCGTEIAGTPRATVAPGLGTRPTSGPASGRDAQVVTVSVSPAPIGQARVRTTVTAGEVFDTSVARISEPVSRKVALVQSELMTQKLELF